MNYKDYFKQRLFEYMINPMDAEIPQEPMMAAPPMGSPTPPPIPPHQPVNYPVYDQPAPRPSEYPSQQTWERDWNKWRQRYRQLVQNWNPPPGPPDPTQYPGGRDDPRYKEDYRDWHRQFMNN